MEHCQRCAHLEHLDPTKRQSRMNLWINERDKQDIKALADDLNLSMSELMRRGARLYHRRSLKARERRTTPPPKIEQYSDRPPE